jgi:hypothetical protein
MKLFSSRSIMCFLVSVLGASIAFAENGQESSGHLPEVRSTTKFSLGNSQRLDDRRRIDLLEDEVHDLRTEVVQIREYLSTLRGSRAERFVCAVDVMHTSSLTDYKPKVYRSCVEAGRNVTEASAKVKASCLPSSSSDIFSLSEVKCEEIPLDCEGNGRGCR